jgi:hypothetical protein
VSSKDQDQHRPEASKALERPKIIPRKGCKIPRSNLVDDEPDRYSARRLVDPQNFVHPSIHVILNRFDTVVVHHCTSIVAFNQVVPFFIHQWTTIGRRLLHNLQGITRRRTDAPPQKEPSNAVHVVGPRFLQRSLFVCTLLPPFSLLIWLILQSKAYFVVHIATKRECHT